MEETKEAPMLFFSMEMDDVIKHFDTSIQTGLTDEEAVDRKIKYGPNQLKPMEPINVWKILAGHTFNFLNGVLLAATIIALAVQSWADAAVIGAIIFINAGIGFSQEYSSEKTMQSLMQLSAPASNVLRSGKTLEVPSVDLVVGDIVLLTEGDKIPADLRLFQIASLECDEAILTGESMPVEKKVDPLSNPDLTAGDQINMAFMSTTVTKGKGRGIVVYSGRNTQMGKIADSITGATKGKTQLQIRMENLGKVLVVIATIATLLVLLGVFIYREKHEFEIYPEGLEVGIATAIAIIPEGLIPVVTLTLTLGVREMAKKKAIVRKMNSLESLGNVTNICTDKTGTLTEGKMVCTNLWTIDGSSYSVKGIGLEPVGTIHPGTSHEEVPVPHPKLLHKLIESGSLCNTSTVYKNEDGDWVGTGSPTEVALVVLAHKVQLDQKSLSPEWEYVNEYPFSSSIKRMSMVWSNKKDNQKYLFLKGAPEGVLSLCTKKYTSTGEQADFSEEDLEEIKKRNETLAEDGLRVLAVSFKQLTSSYNNELKREQVEDNMIFIGLFGIKDPPRQTVPHSVQICDKAGIEVHMVTGDHPSTARAIAKQVGILKPEQYHNKKLVMAAVKFDKIPQEKLDAIDQLPYVIARCTPDSKVKMVKALHDRNKIVAMTGDGVNDAPAIKSADIGIAMGKGGSDVTKESADIVLTDDNFSTIVVAIEEGRRIFANIRKFIIHLLAGNIAEGIILVIGVLAGFYPPMNPLMILWVNMVTGTPAALALGIEPAPKKIMDKHYRPVNEGLFTTETIIDISFYGFIMGIISLGSFIVMDERINEGRTSPTDGERTVRTSQTIAFISLTSLLLVHAYNCRVLREPFYRHGFHKRIWLHVAVLFGFGTVLAAVYIPGLKDSVFKTEDPQGDGWIIALVGTVIFLFLSECYKFGKRRYMKYLVLKGDTTFGLDMDEEEEDLSIEMTGV